MSGQNADPRTRSRQNGEGGGCGSRSRRACVVRQLFFVAASQSTEFIEYTVRTRSAVPHNRNQPTASLTGLFTLFLAWYDIRKISVQ